jgi:uncharacterized membrane protein
MNSKLRYYFFIGLFSILPIGMTLWFMNWILKVFAGPAQSILNTFLPNIGWFLSIKPYASWFFGFLLTFLFVLLCGFIINGVFGKFIFLKIEDLISKIPIANTLYQTIKGITDSISNANKQAFRKVVLIEYPRKGIWTLALVTGGSKNINGKLFYHLYLPTTPNPTSGFMLYIPIEDVIETEMNSEEAIKIIISGGAMSPEINDINISKS